MTSCRVHAGSLSFGASFFSDLDLDLLLAGVGVLLGLALGTEPLGLQALFLKLLLPGAAHSLALRVLLVQLALIHLGQDKVADHAENAVGDPVNTHGGVHDKADDLSWRSWVEAGSVSQGDRFCGLREEE